MLPKREIASFQKDPERSGAATQPAILRGGIDLLKIESVLDETAGELRSDPSKLSLNGEKKCQNKVRKASTQWSIIRKNGYQVSTIPDGNPMAPNHMITKPI